MDNITENIIIEASEGNTEAFESIYYNTPHKLDIK